VTLTPEDSSSARPAASTGAESLSADQAPVQVERMIELGVPFERVEDAIDATSFAAHHKSSLWLLAWSLRDPIAQRRDALVMTGAFGASEHPRHRAPGRPDLDRSAET
jgi:hypothetical protein